MRDKRLVILLSGDELAELKSLAGDVPLAVWVRRRILRGEELATGQASARGTDASGEVISRRLPKAGTPQKSIPAEVPAKRNVKTCSHGIERGYRCWQCGGLAVIE